MSDNQNGSLPVITYGDATIDFNRVPASSVRAMLSRGVTHFLGSEMSSKVIAKFTKKEERPGPMVDGKPTTVTIKVKTGTEAEWDAAQAEFVAAALVALNEGTIGVSTRGPSVDPLEAEIERITKGEVVAILKKNGLKFPKDGETVTFANGAVRTGPEMLVNHAAKPSKDENGKPHGMTNGERIAKEAEKILAEKARAAKKLAAKVAASDGLEGL